ncbi:DUF1990 family protein [Jatrophihabitans sp. YIM 134969]
MTGATSGIGRATARRLAASGDHVVLVARTTAAVGSHAEFGGNAEQHAVDILDEPALQHLVTDVVVRHGRLDAVVHAAQTMAYGRIEDVPAEVFDRVTSTALSGTANLARVVLPVFRRQARGTLVVVNSLLGQIATPRMGVYDSAKWGQHGLARVLQLETRDARDVHVCIVSPGAIDTPIYDQAANFAGRGGFPPPPVVAPERVAAAAVKLLDRPRRIVEVGPANGIAKLGFRFMPAIYDRIVGPLVDLAVFRGEPTADNPGNVLLPQPAGEARTGGWTVLGRRRRARRGEPHHLSTDDAARLAALAVTAPDVGVTRGEGGAVERHVVEIGRGEAEFAELVHRVRHWQVHTRAGLHVAVDRAEIAEGADVVLAYGPGKLAVPAPCRVVWTVDEPRRFGYGLGTLAGHPERGEESFVVSHEPDDRVLLTVASAARPATWWAKAGAPVTEVLRRHLVQLYLHAFTPGR